VILLIDNYDSFTYNLYQYLCELGAAVEVRRNDTITTAEIAALAPERIVISPGPCTPQEAGISVEVIREFSGKTPILGVCLGHQAIGAAFGGAVVRAPVVMHGKLSAIHHDGRGVFADVPQGFTATRYLEITAETSDGIIMGLRHRDYDVEGVQFHPEAILTEHGREMLRNFLSRQSAVGSRQKENGIDSSEAPVQQALTATR